MSKGLLKQIFSQLKWDLHSFTVTTNCLFIVFLDWNILLQYIDVINMIFLLSCLHMHVQSNYTCMLNVEVWEKDWLVVDFLASHSTIFTCVWHKDKFSKRLQNIYIFAQALWPLWIEGLYLLTCHTCWDMRLQILLSHSKDIVQFSDRLWQIRGTEELDI